MLRLGIVWIAVAVYLIVLGCVLIPSESGGKDPSRKTPDRSAPHSNAPLEGLPFCGITMQLQRTDWMDKYEQSIDEIAAMGADTVQLVVDPRQENGKSVRIYLDLRMTPGAEQLGRLIKHAKDKKLRVILMPIILLDDPQGNDWRGSNHPDSPYHPDSWEKWFESYRDVMGFYAWIAEANHVDLLVVGSELVTSENKVEEWRRTISKIREIYHGRLTYSSNWDHYTSVEFWDALDMIGMNSYWKFADSDEHNPSVGEIIDKWREIQSDLFAFQKKVKKPIMFLEIGWFSQHNVAWEPWDYTQESQPIDLDLQKKLYEGFFQSWWGDPHLGGFSVWEWPPNAGGKEDRGYTPKGKPAEQILKQWLAKPRWEVK